VRAKVHRPLLIIVKKEGLSSIQTKAPKGKWHWSNKQSRSYGGNYLGLIP
jgi:hypothetical protein